MRGQSDLAVLPYRIDFSILQCRSCAYLGHDRQRFADNPSTDWPDIFLRAAQQHHLSQVGSERTKTKSHNRAESAAIEVNEDESRARERPTAAFRLRQTTPLTIQIMGGSSHRRALSNTDHCNADIVLSPTADDADVLARSRSNRNRNSIACSNAL